LNPNVDNYKSWSPESIVKYVMTLDDGIYEQYTEQFLASLKENEMTGEDLPELNKNDLFSFGIKVFRHRVTLIKHFQKLAGNDYVSKLEEDVEDDNVQDGPSETIQ